MQQIAVYLENCELYRHVCAVIIFRSTSTDSLVLNVSTVYTQSFTLTGRTHVLSQIYPTAVDRHEAHWLACDHVETWVYISNYLCWITTHQLIESGVLLCLGVRLVGLYVLFLLYFNLFPWSILDTFLWDTIICLWWFSITYASFIIILSNKVFIRS